MRFDLSLDMFVTSLIPSTRCIYTQLIISASVELQGSQWGNGGYPCIATRYRKGQ